MPDKIPITLPPDNVGTALEHWLVQTRAALILHINMLHARVAELIAAAGSGGGPVLITDLEPIPGNRILGRESASPGPVGILEVGDGLWFTGLGMIGVANGGITGLKFRASTGTSVVGRASGSGGPVADIVATADGQFLQRAGGILVWDVLPAFVIPPGSVTNAMLRDSIALSVMGRSINSNGDPGDIATTAASNAVLRESGSALGWGLLVNANIAANAAINKSKLEISSSRSLAGRTANSPGALADIVAPAGSDAVMRESGSTIGWGQVASGGLANGAVLDSKLRNSVALSVIGQAANAAGAPADIPTTANSNGVLREALGTIGWGLLGTPNYQNGSVSSLKFRSSAGLSVVGQPNAITAPVQDIVAGADDTILSRKASVLGWNPPTQGTIYQRVFDTQALWGEAAPGTPTLALTAPTLFNQTSSGNHFVGFLFGDTKITWLRFGFVVPNDVPAGTVLTPRICFLTNIAPVAGNTVEMATIGSIFNDNDGVAGGTPFSVGKTIDVSSYAASDYVIVDLTPFGTTVSAGQYVQGVIQRVATAINPNDTYPDLVAVAWIAFRGSRVLV